MAAGTPTVTATFKNAPVDLVVDVRTRLEFWTGHLPGALCVPVTQIPEALASRTEVSLDTRILVYCASGARSATAAARLRAAGFRRVIDGGGMGAARQHLRA